MHCLFYEHNIEINWSSLPPHRRFISCHCHVVSDFRRWQTSEYVWSTDLPCPTHQRAAGILRCPSYSSSKCTYTHDLYTNYCMVNNYIHLWFVHANAAHFRTAQVLGTLAPVPSFVPGVQYILSYHLHFELNWPALITGLFFAYYLILEPVGAVRDLYFPLPVGICWSA